MIVIDSSLWLEYFASGVYFETINKLLSEPEKIIIPSIIIAELYKKKSTERNEETAIIYTAQLKTYKIIDLDFELSILAAINGRKLKLPMADSIIYATTLKYDAQLYTMDKHFNKLNNVNYLEKSK